MLDEVRSSQVTVAAIELPKTEAEVAENKELA